MEVAVVADHLAGAAELRPEAKPVANLFPAPADRRHVVVAVGQVDEHALDLVVDRRGQQAERL